MTKPATSRQPCEGYEEATLVSLYAMYQADPENQDSLHELHDFTFGLDEHPEWYEGPCLCLTCCHGA